jgi:hypothetical protein
LCFVYKVISNATNILGTNKIKATASGSKFNQHNCIKPSYLNLGNVALNSTNMKQNTQVFIPKIIACTFMTESLTKISGMLYPPKNKIAVIVLNNTIELYSARKKNTKGTEECSVKKPATNSDS